MTEPETLYQLKDLAKVFGVGASAVANWRKRGSGPGLPEPAFVTTGGKPLFTREQVEALAADRIAELQAITGGAS